MKRRLIINADGFGFTFGNNKGILEAMEAGAVRSVSVNSNFPAVEQVGELLERFPDSSAGIHWDLSVGPCVSDPKDIPDMVDDRGDFLGSEFHRKALKGLIGHEQMVRELTAQAERLMGFGVRITHWDSHQNQHLYPPFFRAALEVAKKFGIERMRTHRHYLFGGGPARKACAGLHLLIHPARAFRYAAARMMMRRARSAGMKMADRLITVGLLDGYRKYQKEFWLELFKNLPEGVSEIYCHPGYPDETLKQHARYVEERLEELKILKDTELVKYAEKAGVELISFHQLT